MRDSNGCAFEFAITTDYSMANFRYHHRPDSDAIDSIIIKDHKNFIEKKELTERTISCKKSRNMHIGYIACSNLNNCMKSV